jgi:hypothetical protein
MQALTGAACNGIENPSVGKVFLALETEVSAICRNRNDYQEKRNPFDFARSRIHFTRYSGRISA